MRPYLLLLSIAIAIADSNLSPVDADGDIVLPDADETLFGLIVGDQIDDDEQ